MVGIVEDINKKYEYIYVFGASETGIKYAKKIISLFPGKEISFIDNSIGGQITINSIKLNVYNPKEVPHKKDTCVIIYSDVHYEKMYEQLKKIGWVDENIIFSNELWRFISYRNYNMVKKRIPTNKIELCMDISEHCNLNCQNCDHFSSLAVPKFADLDEFEADLSKMRDIIGDNGCLSTIYLEGGEPLLNSQVGEFAKVARKLFNNSKIIIVSNGLLLPKMQEQFWTVIRENNISISITKYPVNFDYDAVVKGIKAKDIDISYFNEGESVKTSMHKPIDLEGNQDIYNSFHKCYMGNGVCTMLKHGKLYLCTFAPNIEHFNKFFNKNIEIGEKDFIDIYDVKDANEIFEYLSKPISACRYCNVDKWTFNHEWKTSSKNICEWTIDS